MAAVFKPFLIGFAGLMICACSQDGAQAQSSAPVAQSQIQTNWTVDKANSKLGFKASQSGEEFSGEFKEFEAYIKFDPDDLKNAHVIVTIDIASIDAGDTERNDALPGKEWFSIKAFPKAQFISRNFTRTGEGQYEARGELTIKDITRPLNLPFSLNIENGKANMSSSISINRTEFDIGTGMWAKEDWVAHKVAIVIELVANQDN